jgi:hypothetical membrane protein
MSINHADKLSIRKGIFPKNDPPFKIISMPTLLKPFIANMLVNKAMRKTALTLATGFILAGTNGIAIIPEKNTTAITLKRKPIKSLPS